MPDFIPQNWSAFADWLDNLAEQLAVLAPKYNLDSQLGVVQKDSLFVSYWVQARINARAQEKQLTDFVEAVANGSTGDPVQTAPTWALPPNPPAIVAPGIKTRLRSLARQIKANPAYTRADGELLGIIPPEEAALVPENTAPELKCRTMPNYNIEVDFRRYGFDAVRVEFKKKGGTWTLGAILTSSPGTFSIIPESPGDAENLEIRAIFLQKNQPFGVYSPIYSVVASG